MLVPRVIGHSFVLLTRGVNMMSRVGIWTFGAVFALGLAGCTTGPEPVSDEEAIAAVTDEWTAAMVAHDVDRIMALYSEDFSDADGNTKASFRDFIADTIDQGMLNNLVVAREIAVLNIEGDTATYDGIGLSSDIGSVTLKLTFGREADDWKIISLVAE